MLSHITPSVLTSLGGVLGILVIASLIAALLKRLHPDKNYTECR